jgi:hypothetical protein
LKKHIFYTFLFIFIATSVLTLLGVTRVISIPDKYLNILIGLLIIQLVGLVIGLYRATDFFKSTTDESEKSKLKSPEEISEKSLQPEDKVPGAAELPIEKKVETTPKLSNISLEEYFSTLRSLDGKYVECDEFVDSLEGVQVSWKGIVYSVRRDYDGSFSIGLRPLRPLSDNIRFILPVTLSPELEAKAFSLRKGDKVLATGILRIPASSRPYIDANSIEIIMS